MNENSDKMKRERWMDQKSKKIKELTARSLEVNIQKNHAHKKNLLILSHIINVLKHPIPETKPYFPFSQNQ